MSTVMRRYMLDVILITTDLQRFGLEALAKAYITNQLFTSGAICLASLWCLAYIWTNVSSLVGSLQIPWRQIRRSCTYVKTANRIIIAYASLLAVNTRYASLIIIPAIMLVFIAALFVIVSVKNRDHHDGVISPASEETDGNGGVGDKDSGLFLTAVLPCCLLSCMGRQHNVLDNLVVSQFLLFLSSSLGELTLMMAKLPSQVAPAFKAAHGASLVVVLVTAHAMVAELLGDDAVLVCMPELVAALLWLTIHLGHGGSGSATVSTVEAALRRADIAAVGVVAVVLTYLVPIRDDQSSEGGNATSSLLSSYMSALVACAFSVILPSLCVFALRQWRRHTTAAASSSELEAAIRLLSICRDMLLKAVTMFLVVNPVVDGRLRLELQGFATDTYIRAASKVTGLPYLSTV